jgi:hypothetical protein
MKPESAGVSSVEAIERFRAQWLVYRDKIRPLLADAADEVSRTREWVRTDRRLFWEAEVRRRKRQLEQAQQAFFSARFSNLRPATTAEQMAVQRAEKALAEAEQKLAMVKRWMIAFDQQVAPLLKQLEQLRGIATNDVTKGEEYLRSILNQLQLYLSTPPPDSSSSSPS